MVLSSFAVPAVSYSA